MGCDISLSVPIIRDMYAIPRCNLTHHTTWYGIWYHRLSRYIMRYHTGSPQNTKQTQFLRKPTTLLWPTFCSGSLSLPSSCLVFGLAFFVVLLLPIRWTHHRTDQNTNIFHSRLGLLYECMIVLFRFSFLLSLSPFFLVIYIPKMLSILISIRTENMKKSHDIPRNLVTIPNTSFWTTSVSYLRVVAKKRYQAVGFPYNRMLKLSSSRGIMIDPVLSVSWYVVDHSVIIQALKKGLTEHEASDTEGDPRWKCSCPDRLAEVTISRYFSELCWRSSAE